MFAYSQCLLTKWWIYISLEVMTNPPYSCDIHMLSTVVFIVSWVHSCLTHQTFKFFRSNTEFHWFLYVKGLIHNSYLIVLMCSDFWQGIISFYEQVQLEYSLFLNVRFSIGFSPLICLHCIQNNHFCLFLDFWMKRGNIFINFNLTDFIHGMPFEDILLFASRFCCFKDVFSQSYPK